MAAIHLEKGEGSPASSNQYIVVHFSEVLKERN